MIFLWKLIFDYLSIGDLILIRGINQSVNTIVIETMNRQSIKYDFIASSFNLMLFGLNLRKRCITICSKCNDVQIKNKQIIHFDSACKNDDDHDFKKYDAYYKFDPKTGTFYINSGSNSYKFVNNKLDLLSDHLPNDSDYDSICDVSVTEKWGIRRSPDNHCVINIYKPLDQFCAIVNVSGFGRDSCQWSTCLNQIEANDMMCLKFIDQLGNDEDYYVIHLFSFSDHKQIIFTFYEESKFENVIAFNQLMIIFETTCSLIKFNIDSNKFDTEDKPFFETTNHVVDMYDKNPTQFYYYDQDGIQVWNAFEKKADTKLFDKNAMIGIDFYTDQIILVEK